MERINERYRIMEYVAEDACGHIYRVYNTISDRVECLKIFNNKFFKENAIKLFAERFIELSTIKHPNIAELYEFSSIKTVDGHKSNGRRYYYTYEYNSYTDELDYLSLTREESHKAILEICRVIQYLHFRNESYTYLNFENIIFYKEKGLLKVKLRDLSHIIQYKYLTKYNSREVNQFLSPKLIWAEGQDLSADLYSLGIVFYYLYYKYDYRSAPLSLETLEVNDIHNAIHRLTTTIKEDAYANIDDFIMDLVTLVRIPYEFTDRAFYERLNFKNRLIGRDKEINRIVETTEQSLALKREENCFVLHGRKGVGKSRLLHELGYRFTFLGYNVFRTDNIDSHEHFSFFKSVISDIALNEVIDINLVRKYGSEIATLIPNLADHWRISEKLSTVEEMGYLRIANRVYKFIEEYVSNRQLVLIIDDVKDLNYYDLKVLEYLVNTDREIPLFVIAALDIEEVYSNEIGLNFSDRKAAHMSIVNYSYADTSEFIKVCLGQGHDDIKFVSALMTRTNGNPSQIMLAIKGLFEDGKIYIDEQRKWNFSNIDSFKDIEVQDDVEDEYIGLENFDDIELKILFFLSACDIPIIDEIIMEVLSLTAKEFEETINQLKDQNVIESKFSDWGFSYFIDNRTLKKVLFNHLSMADKINYNKDIAEYLESKYVIDQKFLDDRLIYHMEQSEQHDKCAHYSLLYAERLKTFSLREAQSLIYYNKALYHAELVNNAMLSLNTHLAIGDICQETDRLDEALEHYKKAKLLASQYNEVEKEIDAINHIGVIELKQMNYEASKTLFLLTNRLSRLNNYDNGEIKSAVHLVDYYFELQNYKLAMILINHYIPKCDPVDNNRSLGQLYHRQAAYFYMCNQYLESKECFEKAIDVLEETGNEDVVSKCLNNVGAVEMEYLGNHAKALNYFLMAEDLDLRNNIINDLSIFKVNIGAAYFKLDRHEEAVEAYEQALVIAAESNDKRDYFIIVKEIIRDYTILGEYSKVYSLLKKMEISFSSILNAKKYLEQHIFMNIEFYLSIGNYDVAYKWYLKYQAYDGRKLVRNFAVKLFEIIFEENHFQSGEQVTETLLWRLSQLSEIAVSVLDYQLLRTFTLRISKKLLTSSNYILMRKYADYDSTLIDHFDSAFLRLQHAILEAVFLDSRIEALENIIRDYIGKKYHTSLWICHKLLGDEYNQSGNYYESMVHYTTALDMVKNISDQLPEELKRNFIVKDPLKLQLKNRLLEMYGKIIHGRSVDSMLMIESEINSVEDFFDISDFDLLFQNPKFSHDMYEAVFEKEYEKITSVEDVVSKMVHNNEPNIYSVLTYYMQILCADYGRIVFRDDYNGIQKLFELGKPCSDDFELVRNNLYYENEGIYVNVTEDSLYSYMLQEGRKSLLFIPMFESALVTNDDALDDSIYENEIGYVYLESSKVLNSFNQENFKKCKMMINLLKAVLENYRLKILSTVDKLTGVYLRKYTEECFLEQLVNARRDNLELSVIMCDIDKFKHVNDTYGHLKGDEILRQIGAILNEVASDYGFVGRYGGEEFLMILPKTDLSKAYDISEMIRKRIQDEIRVEARKPVTISLGISSYPHHGLSEEELIENADKALYYSKNTGRNKSTKWNKEISGDHYRFDRLAGILTGNSAVDATNMQSIVEVIGMLKLKLDKKGKILKVLENLIDITKAETAYIVECSQNGENLVYMKERGSNQINIDYEANQDLIDQFIHAKNGDYFVNWDALSESTEGDQMPNWKSIIVSPLFDGERSKGIVVVEVPIVEREFDFNNYNYVNLMSGLISAII